MLKTTRTDQDTSRHRGVRASEHLSLDEIHAAREAIAGHIFPTPFVSHPLLSERLGCQAQVKLENAQVLGAFKVRGGLNLLANMPDEARRRGLVTATRGNHGQSIAHAARIHGAPCTIFVPKGNNPDKDAAVKALGAELVVSGHDFDAASEAAHEFAARSGAKFVHVGEERGLVAGVATLTLEMLEQARGPLDAVFYPVGGGSVAAGGAVVLKAMSPATRVIGVQAENAPAMCRAWKSGLNQPFPVTETVADGLAVRKPSSFTMKILRDLLDDMITVSEEEIHEAILCYAQTIHQLAEGAGAVPLAGALKLKSQIAGRRIGLLLSGGNIDRVTLLKVLNAPPPSDYALLMRSQRLASLEYGCR